MRGISEGMLMRLCFKALAVAELCILSILDAVPLAVFMIGKPDIIASSGDVMASFAHVVRNDLNRPRPVP